VIGFASENGCGCGRRGGAATGSYFYLAAWL